MVAHFRDVPSRFALRTFKNRCPCCHAEFIRVHEVCMATWAHFSSLWRQYGPRWCQDVPRWCQDGSRWCRRRPPPARSASLDERDGSIALVKSHPDTIRAPSAHHPDNRIPMPGRAPGVHFSRKRHAKGSRLVGLQPGSRCPSRRRPYTIRTPSVQ